jgi:hypothetical protein
MDWVIVVNGILAQMQGTPYVLGGDSLAGTDCSGAVSIVANVASGRPPFGDRFSTVNEAQELRARGFIEGTAPNALVVGWNGGHTALTMPDGTNVESGAGDGRGVEVNDRGGALQSQFSHHMWLPGSGDSA